MLTALPIELPLPVAIDMSNRREVLQREHDGDDGTFLFQLRCGPDWDKQAYDHLFTAMRECCKELDGTADIPRWIAYLFWHCDWYVIDYVNRMLGKNPPDYYVNAAIN